MLLVPNDIAESPSSRKRKGILSPSWRGTIPGFDVYGNVSTSDEAGRETFLDLRFYGLCRAPGTQGKDDAMERRHFLKPASGFAAGAAALAASARAAPLVPHPLAETGCCRHRTRMPVLLSPTATRWKSEARKGAASGLEAPPLGLEETSLGLAPPPSLGLAPSSLGLAPSSLAPPLLAPPLLVR